VEEGMAPPGSPERSLGLTLDTNIGTPPPVANSSTTPAVTPTSGQRRRNRNYREPVKDKTVADVVFDLFRPKAWTEGFAIGAKRSYNSVSSFRYTTFLDILSGFVLGILMSGFSGVFASTIFDEVELDRYVDVGVASQQISIVISGFFHILFSDAPPVISAPDVNPTIFLGMMANIAQRTIMRGANESAPNIPEREPILITTILVLTILSTAILGVLLMMMGTFGWTRILELIPSSVLCGFMGSVGFTIFYKSLALAMPLSIWNAGASDPDFWRLLVPAIVLGVVMFLRERFQIGRPAIAVPLVMIFPVFIFSVTVFSSKSAEEAARTDGWLFPALERDLPPSRLYEMSYMSPQLVDWEAVQNCMPTMVLMFLVVSTDALLRIAGLKKTLQLFDLRADREVILLGKYNLLNGLLVGVPGYAQASLTRVNTGIVKKDAKSRIPGVIAFVMNLGFLLSGFPLHSYMPRFWLSGILMFAGLQFLADNLIDSRSRLSKTEYFAVWVIIIVNYFFGLAWSVLLSLVLSQLIFTLAYGKEGAIKSVHSGASYRSSSERSARDLEKLQQLGRKALIIRLHRFIFFGSASMVNEFVKGFLDEQRKLVEEDMEATTATTGEAGKCTFFVFDFENVEDIDHTALSILSEMIQRILLSGSSASGEVGGEWSQPVVIFTALNQQLYDTLEEDRIVSSLFPRGNARLERVFASLDLGLEWVEDTLLTRAATIRKKWLAFDSFKRLHSQARAFALNEASDHVLGTRLGSEIFRYTRQLKVPAGATLLERGELDPCAYLIQSGRITLYNSRTVNDDQQGIGEEPRTVLMRVRSLKRGAFLNETVLYADDDAIPPSSQTAIADVDSIVFSLNREDLKVLDMENPLIAIELHRRISQFATRALRFIDKRGENTTDFYKQNNTGASSGMNPARNFSPEPQQLEPANRAAKKRGFFRRSTGGATPIAPDDADVGDSASLLEKNRKVMKKFVRNVKETIADIPLINEGLVIAGFREDDTAKKSLLEVTSLNSGEASGRNIARDLLYADSTGMTFRSLMSLDEFKQQYDTVNDRLEQDWFKITHGSSIVYPDQVSRVLTLTRQEANEMVWEADITGRGGIMLRELLTALTTIDEKEIQVENVSGAPGAM